MAVSDELMPATNDMDIDGPKLNGTSIVKVTFPLQERNLLSDPISVKYCTTVEWF